MGQESKQELQKMLQLLEDVVRDAEEEIQGVQGLTEQEELYLDPEGTLSQALSQALKRRIGAQHTIAELRQELADLDSRESPDDGSVEPE
jgi:hypothetical protein